MERSDTEPFHDFEIFSELIHNSSFTERFDSSDIKEIISSSDDQSSNIGNSSDELSSNIGNTSDEQSSISIWDTSIEFSVSENVKEAKVEINHDVSPVTEPLTIVAGAKKMIQIGEAIYLVNESNPDQFFKMPVPAIDTGYVPAQRSADCLPSLSLQPWKGDFHFSMSLEMVTHSSSKWVYSHVLEKLFLRPFEAVPFEVKLSDWINGGYINITPVYTSSQHKAKPVKRCPNHKMQDEVNAVAHPEHIIQVDNADATYRVDGLRYSVDVPLGVPAPGEASKLLYVKCGCWNTCTGGPNRMAFCLLFTLFNRCKEEIGRQVIQLKVCACPVRDRQYSEKNVGKPQKTDGNHLTSDVTKKKLSGASPTKMSFKKIKAELGEPSPETKSDVGQQAFEQINVPIQIAPEVKRHVNRLMAELHAKEKGLSLPFPGF